MLISALSLTCTGLAGASAFRLSEGWKILPVLAILTVCYFAIFVLVDSCSLGRLFFLASLSDRFHLELIHYIVFRARSFLLWFLVCIISDLASSGFDSSQELLVIKRVLVLIVRTRCLNICNR